jgi:hypothetical protein
MSHYRIEECSQCWRDVPLLAANVVRQCDTLEGGCTYRGDFADDFDSIIGKPTCAPHCEVR